MLEILVWPGLVLLGIAVGAYGTLIGAGGGFILTPLLLILYPDHAPEIVTAISLGVVTTSGISGTVAYTRQHRIDYLAGSLFAGAMVPGAIIGAFLTGLFPREIFQLLFGLMLWGLAVSLNLPRPGRIVTDRPPARFISRTLTDPQGVSFRYSFDPYLSLAIGFAIGVIASMFGVGGGPILVPVMVVLLRFPSYVAVATSTFALVFPAAAASIVHAVQGHYADVLPEEISLALGVLIGAQVGAFISMKLAHRQQVVVRLLSVALVLVGVRLAFGALF